MLSAPKIAEMSDAPDDDDIPPYQSSSRLASIFRRQTQAPAANVNLEFTAPKQPKSSPADKNKTISELSGATVQWVKAILLTKIVPGVNYASTKYGMAIIGNDALKTYELMIYKSQKQIHDRLDINASFICEFEEPQRCYFKDYQKIETRIEFLSKNDFDDFKLALAKRGATVTTKVTPVEKPNSAKTEDSVRSSEDSDGQAKADILSRMARVGQPLLLPPPHLHNVPSADFSDSEREDVPKVTPRTRSKHSIIAATPAPTAKPFVTNPPYQANYDHIIAPVNYPTSSVSPFYQPYMPQLQPPMFQQMPSEMNMLFSENRTHNSEIRMTLMQLEQKVDTLLWASQQNRSAVAERDAELMQQLKFHELEQKISDISLGSSPDDMAKIRSLENKITVMHAELNAKNNELSANAETINALALQFQVENKKLEGKSYDEFYQDNANLKKTVDELNKVLEIQKLKLKDMMDFYEANKDCDKLRKQVADLNKIVEIQKLKLADLGSCYKPTNAVNEAQLTERIKTLMNGMCQNICNGMTEEESQAKWVEGLTQNVRKTTFRILRELKEHNVHTKMKSMLSDDLNELCGDDNNGDAQ